MALFVDGPASTIDDLTDQDSGLADVARTCGINVTTKLRLAHDEIALDLHLWLERWRPTADLAWTPILQMDQIVTTSPLKHWETMMTLSLFYRDAYFSQLVDRYQAKWEEYSRLTRRAYESFVASGMGLVNSPVGKAEPPLLAVVEGPQQGGSFYASVAWVNAAGQEGKPSSASALAVPDGYLMTVLAVGPTKNVVGYNVYAGSSLDEQFLQNSVPLPPGDAFIYVSHGANCGRRPGDGQRPDFVRPLVRRVLRG